MELLRPPESNDYAIGGERRTRNRGQLRADALRAGAALTDLRVEELEMATGFAAALRDAAVMRVGFGATGFRARAVATLGAAAVCGGQGRVALAAAASSA